MNKPLPILLLGLSLLSLGLSLRPAWGQAADAPPSAGALPGAGDTPLSVRQDRVRRLVQDLQVKFLELAQGLEPTEPERAKRLREAIKKMQEARVEGRMEEVVRLLTQSRLDVADTQQKQLADDVRKLIDMLLREDDELERMREEIKRLEEWKKRIGEIAKEEGRLERESRNMSEKDKTLNDLNQRIAAAEALLRRQQELQRQTEQTRKQDPAGVPSLAEAQAALQKDTQALADAGKPEAAGSDKPEVTPQPSDKPGATTQPSDKLGPATQPSDKAAGDESKPSEPGSEALQQASQAQQSATKALAGGKASAAQDSQQQAAKKLAEAIEAMRKEKERIARLPEDHAQRMAGDQDKNADQAKDLSKQMSEAPKTSDAGPQDGQPGQSEVDEAQDQMRQASENLRKNNPSQAQPKQREAIKKLKKAQEEIDKKLAQLRKEAQDQLLAALEARFREMLARQKPLTLTTAALDGKPRDQWDRPERLTCAGLTSEEALLADLAQRALEVIQEDGTTIVFPRIVAQLRDDLRAVAGWLREERTGKLTQGTQKEIERTLEELIAALQRAQEQKQNPPQDQPSQNQPPQDQQPQPLVPTSAELKLLRAAQLRVNGRTTDLDQIRPANPDAMFSAEAQRLAGMQAEVQALAEDMARKK